MPRQNRGPYLSDKPNEHGHYEVRWSEGGRSRRKSTGSGDVGFAQKVLASFILGFDQEAQRPTGDLTIVECLVNYWNEHVRHAVISVQTAAYALRHLAIGLTDFDLPFQVREADAYFEALALHIDGRTVAGITPLDILTYRDERDLGDGAMRRELGVLVAAINHAVRTKRLQPAERPHIALPAEPAARDRWLTDIETARLLAAAGELDLLSGQGRLTRAYRFVAIARYTASRRRAIETLTWQQVDLDRGIIRFNPEGRRQTKKRRPAVPIADILLPILKRAKDEAVSDFVLDHPGAIRKTFWTAAHAAGLGDVTPHTLRHTWATRAAQEGVEMWRIAQVLGDTVATVTARYLHHCPEHLRDAVNAGHNPSVTPGRAHLGSDVDQLCPTPATPDQ